VYSPIGYSAEDFEFLPKRKLAQYTLFRGNLPFGLHQYLEGPAAYATVVCHPATRAARLFEAHRQRFPGATFQRFVEDQLPANGQRAQLGGEQISFERWYLQMDCDDAPPALTPAQVRWMEARDEGDLELYRWAQTHYPRRTFTPRSPSPSPGRLDWLRLGLGRRIRLMRDLALHPSLIVAIWGPKSQKSDN
jgi:hypothetical protein